MSENSCEDQQLRDRIAAPVVKIAVSPNGRFLACYRRDGVLSVFSSNFSTKVSEDRTRFCNMSILNSFTYYRLAIPKLIFNKGTFCAPPHPPCAGVRL